MGKKRVEIIDVTLGIDVAEEIKMKVDSLSSEIVEHTKELIKKSGMKIQRVNKKQKARQERLEKTQVVAAFLVESFEIPDRWCEGKELLEAADIEVTSQNLNKLSMQIRKFLEKEDKWTLSKKRRSGGTVYRLVRFS
jgi:hypothetical protein